MIPQEEGEKDRQQQRLKQEPRLWHRLPEGMPWVAQPPRAVDWGQGQE